MNKLASGLKLLLTPLLVVSSFVIQAKELPISAFEAVYDMYRQGDKLGEGSRTLQALGNDKYSIELSSKINWLIFSDKRRESSLFKFTDDTIQPIAFNYERTGTGKDKNLTVEFKDDGK